MEQKLQPRSATDDDKLAVLRWIYNDRQLKELAAGDVLEQAMGQRDAFRWAESFAIPMVAELMRMGMKQDQDPVEFLKALTKKIIEIGAATMDIRRGIVLDRFQKP